MCQKIIPILKYLATRTGVDFSGYNSEPVKKLLDRRIAGTKSGNYDNYLKLLHHNIDEHDKLITALTINVSEFFRNPVVFHYLAERILPTLIHNKTTQKETTIRAWSAGCGRGEEPYSLAILLNQVIEKEETSITPQIFATDIDRQSLKSADLAEFHPDSIKNIPYGLVKKYFLSREGSFLPGNHLRKSVHFSFHDLLDKRTMVPPESIFGGFDIVLCRNVLIYLTSQCQDIVFKKLIKSLAPDGFLILGETEKLPSGYTKYFTSLDDLRIYQKRR